MNARAAIFCCAVLLGGCPGDFDVENRTFPCRAAADCVEDYECHPTRYVCVKRGTADGGLSAISADAGAIRRGIGDPCSNVGSCDDGICVDGVCCESSCTDDCHRCDLEPGRCTPVQDGTDPDGECENRSFDCAGYTHGLQGSSCFANAARRVVRGTCGPRGACRPAGCDAPGQEISQCENSGCLREDACPAGVAVAAYDEPSELCLSGEAATCTLPAGGDGCCSLLGDCLACP